jgi:hypothetical protein
MTNEEQIKKMYESQLNSQKEQLTTDYQNAISELDTQKKKNQKVTDENLNRTAVEAQKAAVSNEEYYNASGLSSGAKAQARLSQENQALANMTAIRTAQQEADAQVERSRGLLAKEYESAIRKAQADNDLELAKALYEEAQRKEEQLRAEREAAASLMAQSGDYTRYGDLYGLSGDEVAKLNQVYKNQNTAKVATNPYAGKANNGELSEDQVMALQDMLGVTADGKWGPKTREAAAKAWDTADPDEAWQLQGSNAKIKWTDQWGSVDVNLSAKPVLEALKQLQSAGASQWDRKKMLYDAYKDGVLTKEEYLALMQRA